MSASSKVMARTAQEPPGDCETARAFVDALSTDIERDSALVARAAPGRATAHRIHDGGRSGRQWNPTRELHTLGRTWLTQITDVQRGQRRRTSERREAIDAAHRSRGGER
jgi:hypothetical protein